MLEIKNRVRNPFFIFLVFSLGVNLLLFAPFSIVKSSTATPEMSQLKLRVTKNTPIGSDPAKQQLSKHSREPISQETNATAETTSEDDRGTQVLAFSASSASTDELFYSTESVSSASIPLDEWNLPIESLVSAKVRRLSLRVFISDTGRVSLVQLLEINPVSSDLQLLQKVVDLVITTPMQPALLNDKAVPSERTIELVLSKE